ncbi:MAG: hypothetical protein RI940_1432, partial [Bacteroidota bacterium]
MKKWVLFGIGLLTIVQIQAQSLTSKNKILSSMQLANQY